MRNLKVEQQYSPSLDATSEMTGFTTDINAPYTFSSSLPTQVFKVYAKNNATTNYSRIIGEKSYELNDHLGNFNDTWVLSSKTLSGINPVRNLSEATGIRVVISDRKYLADRDDNNTISTGDNFVTEVLSANEYGAFGNLLNGRGFSQRDYRYGFQGQEKDDEVKGEGNSVNYKYRMHDPRVGRFFAIDPLSSKYPFYSPYAFSGNRVIDAVEQEGLQPNVLFDSPDEAAINFAMYYNDNSIRCNCEYGATIWKVVSHGDIKYAYGEATKQIGDTQEIDEFRAETPNEGKEVVAIVHTHGKYNAKYSGSSNYFSGLKIDLVYNSDYETVGLVVSLEKDYLLPGDIQRSDYLNLPTYVATPNGSVQRYLPGKGVDIQRISSDAPSDSKDPERLNIRSSNRENFIKLGQIEFNTDKLRQSTKIEGVFIATDVRTGSDYGVVKSESGNFSFYRNK
jgi:RHS repeat-associated protein